MSGAGFKTRDLAAVARIEDHLLDYVRPHMATEAPDLIVSWLAVIDTVLNEEAADRGLLDRCDHCHEPILTAAVFDDDEQEWLSKAPEQWRRWCSPACRDNAAEGYWTRRWSA